MRNLLNNRPDEKLDKNRFSVGVKIQMATFYYKRHVIFIIVVREEKVAGQDRRARLASSLRRVVTDINSRQRC